MATRQSAKTEFARSADADAAVRAERAARVEHAEVRNEDDVEGHSLSLNPTVGRDLARAREQEMERKAAHRRLEEEARRPFRPKAR